MELADKVTVVTGGASGIGATLVAAAIPAFKAGLSGSEQLTRDDL